MALSEESMQLLEFDEQLTDHIANESINHHNQDLYVNPIDYLFVADNTASLQPCIDNPNFNST